jgi:hypothetical protein
VLLMSGRVPLRALLQAEKLISSSMSLMLAGCDGWDEVWWSDG